MMILEDLLLLLLLGETGEEEEEEIMVLPAAVGTFLLSLFFIVGLLWFFLKGPFLRFACISIGRRRRTEQTAVAVINETNKKTSDKPAGP